VTPSAQYKPLFGVVLLAVALGFVHLTLVSGQRDRLNARAVAWQADQAQIGLLTQIERADGDLLRFRAGLPGQADLPKMVAFVSETAETHRLPIPSVAYDHEAVAAPGLAAVSISFDVTGDYLDIRRFIDALERSDLFLVIEQLTLAASNGEADRDRVRLQIRVAAYMRKADALRRKEVQPQPGRLG